MPTIQLEAHLSADDLLCAADQLPASELAQLVTKLLAIQAHRQAPFLSRPEMELLQRSNQPFPAALQSRFTEPIEKRDVRTLTPEEYAELLRLTDETEAAQAERIQAIRELAKLRRISFDALLQQLGIPGKNHG
jgi:hypothetical protein